MLAKCHYLFRKHLDVSGILPRLGRHDLLTKDDREFLSNEQKSHSRKIDYLVEILLQKGRGWFEKLYVQHRAARWASGSRWNPSSYCWTKSSDDCLVELKWPSIHQRHVYFSVCQVHDILHYHNSTKHFQLSNNNFTRSHPLTIQPISSSINSYRCSFFVNSPFLWNTIPYVILKIKQSSSFRVALRRFLL